MSSEDRQQGDDVLELGQDMRVPAEGTDRAIEAIEAPIRQARADEERYRHLALLPGIAQGDVDQLMLKEREYGASWKKRGGVGAFMMLARKWDRLENMVDELKHYVPAGAEPTPVTHRNDYVAGPYDIFSHVIGTELEVRTAESLLDTIGDLRRYCLLVEAEMRTRLALDAQRRTGYPPAGVGTIGAEGEGLSAERDPAVL